MATIIYSGIRNIDTNTFAISGTTYIIEGTIVINGGSTYNIAKNVTIIFRGGLITGNGKIVGNNTRLIAPITQIFGENIEVKGDWTIDRSYPQWFSNLGFRYPESANTNSEYANPNDNWAPAINNAIKMKGTGEVMIPRGLYYISSPINVNFGITLIGECGRISSPKNDTTNSIHAYGTCIKGKIDYGTDNNSDNDANIGTNNDANSSLIFVNKNDNGNEWQFNHPIPITKIQNLELRSSGVTVTGLYYPTGITSYGACVIDTVVFNILSCGIHFADGLYSDARQVRNCVFGYDESEKYSPNSYAIDCECLGDAVTIQNNHVGNTTKVGALRLRMCGGGFISSNIFNADVRIVSCRSIVYECNHMENGAQLQIVVSNVAVRRNFFEKRISPNIDIQGNDYYDESIVDMEGNAYTCYEYSGRVESDTSGLTLSNLSPFDINIDQHSIVNIKDEYRYWGSRDNMLKMYTFGIQIGGNGWSSESFNNNSHLYSKLCHIIQGKVVSGNITISGTVPQLIAYAINSNIEWLRPSGIYRYETIIVNGNSRQANTTFDLTDSRLGTGGHGVLLILDTGSNYLRNVKIIITRKCISGDENGETHRITLYTCGAKYLYDNGITISGYKWVDV